MSKGDSGAIHHRPRELGFHGHVGELELDCLVLRDRDPERAALLRVSERCIQACLRKAYGKSGDRYASAHERVEELPVPAAALAEQVFLGDLAVLEAQRVRVGRMPAELSI